MVSSPSLEDVLVRLLAAVLLGGTVGWERQAGRKPAGLRTHIMVALGAASFTLIAVQLYGETSNRTELSGSDLTRILQGVVTGIGFLGAGSIIRSGTQVHGMTTAAGIWVVGAVGAACGFGYFAMAAVTSAFALVTLALLKVVEHRAFKKDHDAGS